MPNWCDTTYICEGPKRQIDQLYGLIKKCQKGKINKIPNDFGNMWLGNILLACGCKDVKDKRCRGVIVDFAKPKDNILEIWMDTAWCEQEDVRKTIEKRFPNIRVYYQDVEWGCEYFHSNDVDHKYFKDYAFIMDENDNTHSVKSESDLQNEIADYEKRGEQIPIIGYFKYEKD